MRTHRAVSVLLVALFVAHVSAQISFEEAVAGLSSKDPKARLNSATLLKESGYVESAVPLAKLVSDPDNAVQIEAIAAELAIFTGGRSGPRRVGIVTIEDRSRPAAQQVFDAGPLVLGPAPVPPVVLLVMRLATLDDSAAVCAEAIYGFGALGPALSGRARRDLLQASQGDMAMVMTLANPSLRLAGARAIGRIYERRPGDPPIDQKLGNALINAVNEPDRAMKLAAIDALGAIRERRAIDGLTQLFDFYSESDLGQAALSALARIGDKASVPVFVKQLSSKSTALRISAIEGLARAGDASHISAIQDALNRASDIRVFDAGTFAAAMLINGSIDGLIESLNRPKSHNLARQYLVEVARGHTARLTKYAQDPSPRVRMDIADILALADDPQGVGVVAPLLKDMDKQVSVSAERATAWLSSPR
jgi:HEAT repeat protein